MGTHLATVYILVCALGVGLGGGVAVADPEGPRGTTGSSLSADRQAGVLPAEETDRPVVLAKTDSLAEKEIRAGESASSGEPLTARAESVPVPVAPPQPVPAGLEQGAASQGDPSAASPARATLIHQIRHEQVETATGGESRVIIETNGAVHPNIFLVDGERLVVDLPETASTLKKTRIAVTDPYIKRIRVGQHAAPEKKVRVVLDLRRKAAHAVRIEGEQVIVALAKEFPSAQEAGSVSAAPPAIGASANPPKADEPALGGQEPVKVVKAVAVEPAPQSEPIARMESNPSVEPKPAPQVDALFEKEASPPAGRAGAIRPNAEQPLRVASLPGEKKSEVKSQESGVGRSQESGVRSQESGAKSVTIPVQVAEAKTEAPPAPEPPKAEPPAAPAEVKKEEAKPAELPAELLEPPAKPKPAAKKKAAAKKKKPAAAPEPETPVAVTAPEIAPSPEAGAGKKISLDFQDADIVNVLRLVAEVGGYNIVVSDEVKGKITVKLLNVPWEQALEVILKTKHLGQVRDQNIIRVAPLTVLTKEQEEIQKRKAAAEKAEDLVLKTHALNFSRAKELEPTLKKQLSPRGELMMDERTNTIVIRDIQSKVDSIVNLAKGLDRPTAQVLIEARVVEIDNKYSRELGVKWGGRFVASPATGNALPYKFPHSLGFSGGIIGSQTPAGGLIPPSGPIVTSPASGVSSSMFQGNNYAVSLPVAAPTSAIGLALGAINNTVQLDIQLSALESDGKAKVLATPKVLALDNKKATIRQGKKVPFVTTSAAGTKVEFHDAFLRIDVTPRITPDGHVGMEIKVTDDDVDFANRDPVFGNPPINVREATTDALMKDGETIVLGGILRQKVETGLDKVPLLGDIPGPLGHLFKKTTKKIEDQELMIFITPRVVKQEAVAQR